MTGSVIGQIQALFQKSGIISIGTKRHQAKAFARAAGASTSQEVADKCLITSYETLDKYRNIAILLGKYIKTEYRQWNVELTTANDIKDYLEFVIDEGLSLRTFKTYAAGLGKLAMALNMYAVKFHKANKYDFSEAINSLRPIAKAELDLKKETREYANPKALIEVIRDPLLRIVALIQYEAGARIREAALIKCYQLYGTCIDDVTGREVGRIFLPSISTKGGREREVYVSLQTYTDLSRILDSNNGVLKIDHDHYRYKLKKAAEATNQRYTGSHGLRHSFAQRRLQECYHKGMGEITAKLRVAHEMGHSRPAITGLYLKKPAGILGDISKQR
ncbi:MAG: hypothetical protein NT178_18395 [Proteobacteria bacterium]|nr:hypothetical protein [Pseudomonadota bacterium]